jgi:hypothetical protein
MNIYQRTFRERTLALFEFDSSPSTPTQATDSINASTHTPTSLDSLLSNKKDTVETYDQPSNSSSDSMGQVKSQPEVSPGRGIIDNNFDAGQDTSETINDITKNQSFFDRYSAILNN